MLTTSLDGGTTWALVNVLVNVLDSLDRTTDFLIDMTVKLNQEFSWMSHHMLVVKNVLALLNSPSILRASIIRITILLDNCLIGKGLGEMLFTDIVL